MGYIGLRHDVTSVRVYGYSQIKWVSVPKFLKIIEYLLKTYGYFTRILPLSLALYIVTPSLTPGQTQGQLLHRIKDLGLGK